MQVPSLKTWQSGDLVNENDLNTHVRDAMNFFKSPPFVLLTRGGSQSAISSGSWQFIPWLGVPVADNDGMFDNGEPAYITVRTPGLYALTAALMFTPYGNAGVRGVSIDYIRGDTSTVLVIARGGASAPNADPYANQFNFKATPEAHACAIRTQAYQEARTGDRFRVAGYHDAGSTSGPEPGPYANGPSHTQSFFMARWIAALSD